MSTAAASFEMWDMSVAATQGADAVVDRGGEDGAAHGKALRHGGRNGGHQVLMEIRVGGSERPALLYRAALFLWNWLQS